jgi:ribosomal protein S18 acetylase RimI-like enzyme
MPEIAEDEPLSVNTLAQYQRDGRAWVTIDAMGRVVAYLINDRVDGNIHIEQVSVDPGHARRGLGRSLIDQTADVAAASGVSAVTLTTFRDVPWNAPYYVRCGFRILDESAWTPGLRAIRAREADHGFDRWPRVCMRRDLG